MQLLQECLAAHGQGNNQSHSDSFNDAGYYDSAKVNEAFQARSAHTTTP